MPNVRIYLRIIYYKYNTGAGDNGLYALNHQCASVEEAQQLRDKLNKGIGIYTDASDNHTGGWLYRKTGIDGFIERIEGIYEETTRKVA